MAKLLKFPTPNKTNRDRDPLSAQSLTKIYADCRRRNRPYPLAVFDGLDDEDELGDRPGVDVERDRTRDRE